MSKSSFRSELEKISKEFNLTFYKGGFLTNPSLDGIINGKKITITKETSNKKSYLNIIIYHNTDINGEFNITKESLFSKLKGAAGIGDIKTYYKDFDAKMLLSAYPSINLTALLNEKVTNDILAIADHTSHLEITKNIINIKLNMDMISPHVPMAAYIIKTANTISKNLCEKKSIKQRLIENIDQGNELIRLHNLHSLIDKFADNKDVQTFLKSLLKDIDENIQVAAAKELKEEGLEHLLKLLKKQFKNNYIFSPDIITFFGEKKFTRSIPLLLDIYKETDISSLKSVVLLSLKDFAEPSVSDFLVKELDNKDPDLRDKAINALASCGKREAVEPLYKLNKTVFNPAAKNLIQEAISKIQSRLGTVDMGALSIAEHTEKDGALSISDEKEIGGLSLTDDEKKSKGLLREGGT